MGEYSRGELSPSSEEPWKPQRELTPPFPSPFFGAHPGQLRLLHPPPRGSASHHGGRLARQRHLLPTGRHPLRSRQERAPEVRLQARPLPRPGFRTPSQSRHPTHLACLLASSSASPPAQAPVGERVGPDRRRDEGGAARCQGGRREWCRGVDEGHEGKWRLWTGGCGAG